MEVELTSAREDGTFTWRAVGAREPRGLLEQKLAPTGAHVGDVLRVEAEFELDGITITSVLPSKSKTARTNVIEIATRPVTGEVTTSLVGRGGARPPRPGGPREGGDRDRPRRDGPPRPGGAARTARPHAGAGESRPTSRDGAPSAARPERRGASDRPRTTRERPARPEGAESSRPRPPRAAEHGGGPSARPSRPRPQRLVPKTVHLDAYLESLPAEQRPIAEQLVAGGLPAVRQALDGERTAARAEGRTNAPGDAILTLAERLLPGVREALWLDRAEAAVTKLEGLSLRDLRAAVLGAAPRDDHGRELLAQLRAALDERVTKLRTAWENDMSHALDEGRVLQALRVSARPPEPTARFPAALVTRLVESASEAMTGATPADRWIALLEAVVASPVRRSVKPSGLPEDPSGVVRQQAQAAAGRVPALAPLLGLTMPPPPRPLPPPPPRSAPARRPSTGPAPAAAAPAPAPEAVESPAPPAEPLAAVEPEGGRESAEIVPPEVARDEAASMVAPEAAATATSVTDDESPAAPVETEPTETAEVIETAPEAEVVAATEPDPEPVLETVETVEDAVPVAEVETAEDSSPVPEAVEDAVPVADVEDPEAAADVEDAVPVADASPEAMEPALEGADADS